MYCDNVIFFGLWLTSLVELLSNLLPKAFKRTPQELWQGTGANTLDARFMPLITPLDPKASAVLESLSISRLGKSYHKSMVKQTIGIVAPRDAFHPLILTSPILSSSVLPLPPSSSPSLSPFGHLCVCSRTGLC